MSNSPPQPESLVNKLIEKEAKQPTQFQAFVDDNGAIMLQFSRPTTRFVLDQDTAIKLARYIIKKTNEQRRNHND